MLGKWDQSWDPVLNWLPGPSGRGWGILSPCRAGKAFVPGCAVWLIQGQEWSSATWPQARAPLNHPAA